MFFQQPLIENIDNTAALMDTRAMRIGELDTGNLTGYYSFSIIKIYAKKAYIHKSSYH